MPSVISCDLDDDPGCVPLFRWARELSSIFGAHLKCVHAILAVDDASDLGNHPKPANGNRLKTGQ